MCFTARHSFACSHLVYRKQAPGPAITQARPHEALMGRPFCFSSTPMAQLYCSTAHTIKSTGTKWTSVPVRVIQPPAPLSTSTPAPLHSNNRRAELPPSPSTRIKLSHHHMPSHGHPYASLYRSHLAFLRVQPQRPLCTLTFGRTRLERL